MAHLTKNPNKPVCETCGRRVEFLNGSRFITHLSTVAGKEADRDHMATMAPTREEKNHGAGYAWIIDSDHLARVPENIIGPRDATSEEIALAKTSGACFRLYDNDGELYFSGRCWVADCDNSPRPDVRYPTCIGNLANKHFGPLNDYGMPAAGCTEIRYRCADGRYLPL